MVSTMVESSPIEKLVRQAREGDRAAFDRLVRQYEPRLRAAVGKMRQGRAATDVDEIVQETFVRALDAIGRFSWQGAGSFHSWLCGIARNVTLKAARGAKKTRRLQVPDRLPASAPSPSKMLRRGERADRLEAALASLPPDYREVLRLSRIERLKIREIAQCMDRSEFAVKHLMARAVRQLRAAFGETESLHLIDRPLDLEGGEHESE